MTPPSPSTPQQATLPFRLGPYEAIAQIGVGGMASVYVARRRGVGDFERHVALKILHRDIDSATAERFREEARITASLHHPNVCTPIDFGLDSGIRYLALEWLIGEPLSTVLRAIRERGEDELPISGPALVCTLLADACDGLHAAHEQTDRAGAPLRIVHRDISPSNIFVTYDGQVKVIDFGIANDALSGQHTAARQVVGKLAYMSPEQLRGEPLDRRTDVWSIGVVLWEGLAGRPLFGDGSVASATARVLTDVISPPSTHHAAIRPGLDRLTLRALERDRDARCPSARSLASELRAELRDHGELLLPSDVALAMEALFPRGREERRALAAVGPAAERGGALSPSSSHEAPPLQNRQQPAARAGWLAVGVVGVTLGAWLAARGRSESDAGGHAPLPAPRDVERTEAPAEVVEPVSLAAGLSPTREQSVVTLEQTPTVPATSRPRVDRARRVAVELRPLSSSTQEPVTEEPAIEDEPAPTGAVRVIMQGPCFASYHVEAAPGRTQSAGRALAELPVGPQHVIVRVGATEIRRDISIAPDDTAIVTVPCP
jgi:serine/threonine-protein kinase